MLPAPKIVKGKSNRTDLHAKIAEPPPIFYKDNEKNTPCQMKRHLSMFRRCRSVAFFGCEGPREVVALFDAVVFPEKARYRTDWKIGPEKTRFLRSFALCFLLRFFPISVYFSCIRLQGVPDESVLRVYRRSFRICPAFCLPNYELIPISESMYESPFRCRCVVAEDAGFARKRVDYMIDVIRKTPSVRNPNRRGIK